MPLDRPGSLFSSPSAHKATILLRSSPALETSRSAHVLKSFDFEDGLVLWDRTTSRLMAFNAATAAVWPKIEAGCLPREVAGDLARFYGLSPERALKDVNALFAELSGLGVLDCARLAPEAEGKQTVDSSTTARSAAYNACWRASVDRSRCGSHRIFAPAFPWANERRR
jgi:Coenzyme PQQ synthesis protein D (PqqD)